MSLAQILPRAAALWPERTAVVCSSRSMTYQEFAQRVARLASALSSLGCKPGDRIAVLHRNCHRFLEMYFAAAHLGAVLVPLNHRLTATDLAFALDDTSSRLLVADDGWAELAGEAIDRAQTECSLVWSRQKNGGPLPAGGVDLEDMIKSQPESVLPSPDVDDHDPSAIYYTSGTTGHQKGVVLTHRNVSSHALATIAELQLNDRDRWAHVAPMFHLADAWATWAITWVGGRHVLVDRFEPTSVFRLFAEQKITVTNLIPTMLNDLVNHPQAGLVELPAFRLVMSGGAPISPQLVRRIVETFGCEYVQTYGLTETSPYLTFSLLSDDLRRKEPEEQMRYRAMTGRPALGVELRVVDEHGFDVPCDGSAVGEILARGDRVTPGYWQQPEATAEAFTDDWFRTGDLATIEARGYLNIVDRKKDVILTGGETVFSSEVENALYEHPAVLETAIVGVPDERLGELVTAVVVLRENEAIKAEELIEHCRNHLAHYKCPRKVVFVDQLPRTGTGKISKKIIREELAKRA